MRRKWIQTLEVVVPVRMTLPGATHLINSLAPARWNPTGVKWGEGEGELNLSGPNRSIERLASKKVEPEEWAPTACRRRAQNGAGRRRRLIGLVGGSRLLAGERAHRWMASRLAAGRPGPARWGRRPDSIRRNLQTSGRACAAAGPVSHERLHRHHVRRWGPPAIAQAAATLYLPRPKLASPGLGERPALEWHFWPEPAPNGS